MAEKAKAPVSATGAFLLQLLEMLFSSPRRGSGAGPAPIQRLSVPGAHQSQAETADLLVEFAHL